MVIKPFITLCWPPIYFLVKIKISVTICRGPNGPTPDYLWNDLSLPASSLHLLLNRTLHLLSSKAELAAAHHSRPYSSAAPCPSEEVWIIYKSIRQGLFFPSLLCYNTNSIYPGARPGIWCTTGHIPQSAAFAVGGLQNPRGTPGHVPYRNLVRCNILVMDASCKCIWGCQPCIEINTVANITKQLAFCRI